MTGLADQFRAALRRQRRTGAAPGALPAPRRLLALPAPPGAERGPVSPSCRTRHPRLLGGIAPTYATPIDGSQQEGRLRPLRVEQGEHAVSLHRDRFTPWRTDA